MRKPCRRRDVLSLWRLGRYIGDALFRHCDVMQAGALVRPQKSSTKAWRYLPRCVIMFLRWKASASAQSPKSNRLEALPLSPSTLRVEGVLLCLAIRRSASRSVRSRGLLLEVAIRSQGAREKLSSQDIIHHLCTNTYIYRYTYLYRYLNTYICILFFK